MNLIRCADAGKEAVGDAKRRGGGRDVGAHLGEQGDQGHLADVGRFARHVGAGNQQERIVGAKLDVVGDKLRAELLLKHGMSAIDDFQNAIFGDGGPAVAALLS